MPVLRLLDDAQHKRFHDLYMREARKPMECVPILMNEFPGLTVTPKQLGDYACERHWAKRKKALIGKAERKASQLVNVMANNIAKQKLELQEQHKAFLEKSATLGAKVLEKAETMVSNTNSARDLSSAANAAAKGIEIYRKAVGLDGEKGGANLGSAGHTFVLNFARAPGSPFAPKPVEINVSDSPTNETLVNESRMQEDEADDSDSQMS